MEPSCPKCHAPVRPIDYFCYNCGKNLKAKPLSTTLTMEILCYLGSLTLPPLGIWWGLKYLRQPDAVSKRIGIISIVLTVIASIITIVWTMNFIGSVTNQINSQLNGQLNGFPGL